LRREGLDVGWFSPNRGVQAEALKDAGIHPNKVLLLDGYDEASLANELSAGASALMASIYHLKFNPPPEDVDASSLIQRADA